MERYFNTEGQCNPDIHYMVRLEERLKKIKERFVDRNCYFVINKGRQFGKTTTLMALAEYLKEDYVVLSLDFQKMSNTNFENEHIFVLSFIQQVEAFRSGLLENVGEEVFEALVSIKENEKVTMDKLFLILSNICGASRKPVVMLIDEVDSASNNQVFIDFLAMLRGYYLDRNNTPTFQSVVLAGVYDIKNLKRKLRPEGGHQYNSPWNIAAKFNIDMSFSAAQIASMLQEYEADHHTGMNVLAVAECIFGYTSGYPYLVSAICKLLDEDLPETERFKEQINIWTEAGVAEAVKQILGEPAPLFESMVRQLEEYPEMKQMLNAILFQGKRISYNADTLVIHLASMFGYVVNRNGIVQVANRIFETRLYNLFLSEDELHSAIYNKAQADQSRFISHGKLNMDLVIEKFVVYFTDIYGDNDEKFIEEYGRKFFLLYLKPIINGTGNYYIEARTRDARRTDVIVDYLGEQFIVELKIWHGNEYNERGEEQLADYLEYYHQKKGYLISFNFNKKKEVGIKEVIVGDKMILEAVI